MTLAGLVERPPDAPAGRPPSSHPGPSTCRQSVVCARRRHSFVFALRRLSVVCVCVCVCTEQAFKAGCSKGFGPRRGGGGRQACVRQGRPGERRVERGIRPALCRRRPGRGRTCARVSQSRSPSRKHTCDASNIDTWPRLSPSRSPSRTSSGLWGPRAAVRGTGPCRGWCRTGCPPPSTPLHPPPPPAGPRFALPPSASRSRGGVGCWPGSLVPSPASSPPAPPRQAAPHTRHSLRASCGWRGRRSLYEHRSRIPSPPPYTPRRTWPVTNV